MVAAYVAAAALRLSRHGARRIRVIRGLARHQMVLAAANTRGKQCPEPSLASFPAYILRFRVTYVSYNMSGSLVAGRATQCCLFSIRAACVPASNWIFEPTPGWRRRRRRYHYGTTIEPPLDLHPPLDLQVGILKTCVCGDRNALEKLGYTQGCCVRAWDPTACLETLSELGLMLQTISGPKGGVLGEKRANVCTITARRHLLGLTSGLDMWLAATRSCHMPSLRQP